jgi:hypothetical protein
MPDSNRFPAVDCLRQYRSTAEVGYRYRRWGGDAVDTETLRDRIGVDTYASSLCRRLDSVGTNGDNFSELFPDCGILVGFFIFLIVYY